MELTRARDHAVLLTDDRDGLVEALETAKGDELSALEAIGGQFREEEPREDVHPKSDVAQDAREKIRTRSQGLETMDAVDSHLLRRLEERRGLQDAAGGGALASVAGYAAWREKTAAALDAMREASRRLDGTAAAEELRLLLDFDDGVKIVEERLYRLVAETGDTGEKLALHPDFKDLAQLAVVLEAEAPLSARLTADLAALPGLYEEVMGAPLPDPFIADDEDEVIEEESRTAATDVTPMTAATDETTVAAMAESTTESAEMHDDAGLLPAAPDVVPAAPAEPSPDVAAERLGALIAERRAMIAEADGRLVTSLAAHAGWRERALAAVDDWRSVGGDDGEDHDDAARLDRAIERDGRMADLARRLAAHEAAAKEAGDDPMAGVDANFLALDCIDLALQARLHGEALPRFLVDFEERRTAWRNERTPPLAQSAPRPDAATPAETTVAARPAESRTAAVAPTTPASPRPAPKPEPSPQPAAKVTPSGAPSPQQATQKPAVKPAKEVPRPAVRPAPSAPKPVVRPAPPAPKPVVKPEPATPALRPTMQPARPRHTERVPSPPVSPPPPAGPDSAAITQAVARALRDRRALQETADGRPLPDMASWFDWARDAETALARWKALAPADRQGAADAECLERLIAFDLEADRLAMAWRSHETLARLADSHPLDHPGAGEILAATRRLRDGAPADAVLPRALAEAIANAETRAAAHARAAELLEPVRALDLQYRALLDREGTRDRPLSRRWNRSWSRWRREANALAPAVEELKGLLPHLGGIEDARALVGSLAWTIPGKRDFLPGWLLLRLHDNAGEAARLGLNPTQTSAWPGLVGEMGALMRRLKEDDPRHRWLDAEIDAHHRRVEAQRTIGLVLRRVEGCVPDSQDLRKKADREALPLVQSNAWIDWHDTATMRAGEARQVLDRHGNDRGLLGDGTGWAARLEAAIKAIDAAIAEHGEPDRSVQARKQVEQMTNPAQKRGRSRGFSM